MKWIKLYENFERIKAFRETGRVNRDFNKYSHDDEFTYRSISQRIKDGETITDEDKMQLDIISGYKNLYEDVESWLNKAFNIFRKYSIEDIEDRLVEYFDKLISFKPLVMFSISNKKSHIGISYKEINNNEYFQSEIGHILLDILYECTSEKISIEQYFKSKECSLYIDLNYHNNINSKYNLLYIESIVDDIVKRLSTLYNISRVEYGLPREGRKYDLNTDIYDYSFNIYLN